VTDPAQTHDASGSATLEARPRRLWLLALLGALVAAGFLAGYCGIGALVPDPGPSQPNVPVGQQAQYPVPPSVTWFGHGLLAIQTTVDGEPSVSVVDAATGVERTASPYVLVTAELGAPVLWLLPMTAEEWSSANTGGSPPPGMRPYDAPPDGLEVWDLADPDAAPVPDAGEGWSRIDGPAGYTAYCDVDPLKGAFPSSLMFNFQDSRSQWSRAALPDDLVTFAPIGFSASGLYFAAEELHSPEAWEGADQPGPGQRRVVIVEAQSGRIAATASLTEYSVFASPRWHPERDVLVWPEPSAEDTGGAIALRALQPDGETTGASELLGLELPHAWGAGSYVSLAGAGPNGIVYLEQGERSRLWRLGSGGLAELGDLPWSESTVYDETGGFASLEVEYDDAEDSEWTVVAVYDDAGTKRRVVWRSLLAEDCNT